MELVALKDPLQRLDITILDNNLFNRQLIFLRIYVSDVWSYQLNHKWRTNVPAFLMSFVSA